MRIIGPDSLYDNGIRRVLYKPVGLFHPNLKFGISLGEEIPKSVEEYMNLVVEKIAATLSEQAYIARHSLSHPLPHFHPIDFDHIGKLDGSFLKEIEKKYLGPIKQYINFTRLRIAEASKINLTFQDAYGIELKPFPAELKIGLLLSDHNPSFLIRMLNYDRLPLSARPSYSDLYFSLEPNFTENS